MKDFLKEFGKDIIVVAVVVLAISFFIKPIVVQGISMLPTLETKDYLLVSRQAYNFGEPERGDIVVFPHEEGTEETYYIKRIIALPGDHLVIKDGKVYINNKVMNEDYIAEDYTSGDIDYKIPEGRIFVMGDNRGSSSDSRYFGTVKIDEVLGEAFVRLFPFSKIEVFK